MKARNVVVLGATALGLGAAAVGAYRSTHPADAKGPVRPVRLSRITEPIPTFNKEKPAIA